MSDKRLNIKFVVNSGNKISIREIFPQFRKRKTNFREFCPDRGQIYP